MLKDPQTRLLRLAFLWGTCHQDWLHLTVACLWSVCPLHKHTVTFLHSMEWVVVIILLTIFISSYLTWGVWSDTGECVPVNFRYYLILQTRLLMLARASERLPNAGARVHLRLLFQSHRKK